MYINTVKYFFLDPLQYSIGKLSNVIGHNNIIIKYFSITIVH